MPAYAGAVRAEAERVRAEGGLAPASSVFFGGGTPSLMPAELLESMLAAIPRQPGAEVSIEANPDTVSTAGLSALRRAGFNRISFGAQSMLDHVLVSLGRSHRRGAVEAAVEAAGAAGFRRINLDLIFGAVGESVGDWARSLEAVLALGVSHVSAYALTVEPGTALARDPSRHPDPDHQADAYLLADRVLGEAGLEWYEISNFARPGHECAHNRLYWDQGNYRGLGCSSHSHADGRRWWNLRTPERYIDAVATGGCTVAGEERLDPATRAREALELSLRTKAGVPAERIRWDDDIAELVEVSDGRAVLTPRGRLLANEVALRLS